MNCLRVLAALLSALCLFSSPAAARERDDDDRFDRDDRKADPALVAARQKFFGIENVDERGRVDKGKVIFSWATNTTYAVSVQGRIILLDSYINRPELPTTPLDTRRTPILPQDFVALRPEAIFLGHGHGDHADNAAYVSKWTGATIYASAETCDVMQADTTRMWNDPNLVNGGVKIIPNGDPVKCVAVVPRASPPGEYTGTLANPEGRTFTFAFVNSAGPVKEGIGTGSPGLISLAQYNDPVNNGPAIALAAEIGKGLFGIMSSLPHTDVLMGSIVSLGADNNQQRDIITYIQHLRPKVYYPGHLTDVAQAGSALYHKMNWRQTALAMGFPQGDWPEFRLLVDPNDFMVPQAFNVNDERWEKSREAEERVRSQCR